MSAPGPACWTNEQLLEAMEDVSGVRKQDEFEASVARIRERCGEAMARYVAAVHRNASLAEKERLWEEVLRT